MTRCGLAEWVKGWPPGCGVRGLCPLAAGFFLAGDVGRCGGPRCRLRAVGLLVCGG